RCGGNILFLSLLKKPSFFFLSGNANARHARIILLAASSLSLLSFCSLQCLALQVPQQYLESVLLSAAISSLQWRHLFFSFVSVICIGLIVITLLIVVCLIPCKQPKP